LGGENCYTFTANNSSANARAVPRLALLPSVGPGAVDVTIGDMVRDAATDKNRDVDVTVTVAEADGTRRAF